jgi:hypothetical protein
MNSLLKNSKKIFTDVSGADSGLTNRVITLEDNEYKITYFTEISNSAGTITIPTGATILLDQFQSGIDAYVSTIQNSQPTGDFPKTSGGATVDVTSFDALGNYTLSGTPNSYPVALIYILKIKAKDYSNLNITKILDLEGSSIVITPNPQEVYVDANVGNDTTGNGSVIAPYQTIQHAVTFCTDPTKTYSLILGNAVYTGANTTIPANVNIEGNGAELQFNLTLGAVGLAGTDQAPFYVTCRFQEFTFDLSPFLVCLPTFDNCSIDKLTRLDATVGPFLVRFSDGSCNDFSVVGNVAFDNTLFLNAGTVETGGNAFIKNTVVGITIDIDAGGTVLLLAGVFVGPTGILNALNPSAIVNIDSSSASGFGGTIVGTTNINYLDNAQTIKYDPTTPANWPTVPTTVQEGLDELSSVISSSVTGVSATSPITSTGGTTPDISTSMNTNKLIGRGTAGVGVMEEITLGTGLSLTGTTLDATGGGGLKSGTATGTNTYAVTITGVTSYTDGDAYVIKFTNGNDDDSTININSLGAKNLEKQANIRVTGGDIVAGQELIIIYDGTHFQCIGVAPNQLFAYVTNDDSVTINKGQPVYAFGSSGNRMSVKLANNTSDATSAQTVGVVFSTSIAPNQRGFIITQGVISGLNTGMYSPGDQLYLGATAGSLTSVKPYAPNHLVYIGIVERANAGNGQIYIKPQNGYELDELHDVDLITTPPVAGDVLSYDGSLWKAEPQPAARLFNYYNFI